MREDVRVLKNWRKINCWAQIITRRSRYGFWWFVLNNWFFFNFLTPAHPHAQSLFLFPIVFGINLSLSLSHRKYLTHNIGSASALPIITAFTNGDVNLFADDTSAFTVPDSVADLQCSQQAVADELSFWFSNRAMTINVSKTAVIIGSAEALPILCVRYFRWERERD